MAFFKILIEKLPKGCLHMTCRCHHEFCWTYAGDWMTHPDPEVRTYLCTVPVKVKESASRETQALEMRKMERFQVYSDVYVSLKGKEDEAIAMLSLTNEMHMVSALRLVADCCKVLRYSYVSSFNMTDNPTYKGLFEQQQNDLRVYVDQLFHHIIMNSSGEEKSSGSLSNTRDETIKNLTSLLKTKYVPNLKISFEAISSSNKERSKRLSLEERIEEFITQYWTCYKCTFISYDMGRVKCEMCDTKRLCTICGEVMRDSDHKATCIGKK